jgi:hypothetical protein
VRPGARGPGRARGAEGLPCDCGKISRWRKWINPLFFFIASDSCMMIKGISYTIDNFNKIFLF